MHHRLPEPLLKAVQAVLGIAGRLRPAVDAQAATGRPEREVWAWIDELKACYERDRPEIEAAHQVLQLPLMKAPGFTRPLS